MKKFKIEDINVMYTCESNFDICVFEINKEKAFSHVVQKILEEYQQKDGLKHVDRITIDGVVIYED